MTAVSQVAGVDVSADVLGCVQELARVGAEGQALLAGMGQGGYTDPGLLTAAAVSARVDALAADLRTLVAAAATTAGSSSVLTTTALAAAAGVSEQELAARSQALWHRRYPGCGDYGWPAPRDDVHQQWYLGDGSGRESVTFAGANGRGGSVVHVAHRNVHTPATWLIDHLASQADCAAIICDTAPADARSIGRYLHLLISKIRLALRSAERGRCLIAFAGPLVKPAVCATDPVVDRLWQELLNLVDEHADRRVLFLTVSDKPGSESPLRRAQGDLRIVLENETNSRREQVLLATSYTYQADGSATKAPAFLRPRPFSMPPLKQG